MFKSPSRQSNPNSTPPRMSTRRSPARSSKSPARTNRSPTRTSKSPARTSKSPGRISKKLSKEEISSSSNKPQTAKMELTPPTKKKSTRSPTRKANSVAEPEPVVFVKKVSVSSKPFGTTVSRTTVLETKKSVRSFGTADVPHVTATKDSKTYITGREQRPLLSEDFKLSFLGRQPHMLIPPREHTWRKPTVTSTHEDSTEMTYKFSSNSGSSMKSPSTESLLKSGRSLQREDSPFVSIARRSIRGDSPFLVADRGSTRSDSPSVSTAGRSVREDSPAVTLLRRETRGSVLRELNSHSTPIREITPLPTQIYSPKFKLYDYKPIVEFGGWFGALAFIFILPISVLALHLHCNKTSCSFVDNTLNIPLNWQAYFDPMAAAIYLGFVAFLLVLYFLPVGEHIEAVDSRAVSYRCNGFLTTLVGVAVVVGLHYQGYPVTIVYDKYIQLIVSSLVFGYILAFILFFKGGRVPTYGNNHIYLFWMGRDVTPHFGPVAVKVLIFRIGVIGSVVLTSALVVKHFGPNPSQYSPTLVVSVAMQIIYLLDSLWFEKVWATSFEFKYEGVGAMLAAGYCVYPFLNTLVVKYVVEHR
ncbi:unnamed protein product [Timema podura]|uniref:Uncharacterized protein n=1 Tax=Timema podura TaxID=61482 RepID=A0ABN7NZX9_TIMPD|nr:unnamed protein product [Timema podura]